jgi:hypothetical protein
MSKMKLRHYLELAYWETITLLHMIIIVSALFLNWSVYIVMGLCFTFLFSLGVYVLLIHENRNRGHIILPFWIRVFPKYKNKLMDDINKSEK